MSLKMEDFTRVLSLFNEGLTVSQVVQITKLPFEDVMYVWRKIYIKRVK